MMRNVGGRRAIASCGAILKTRANVHFAALASDLTPTNGTLTPLPDGVAARYFAVEAAVDDAHLAAFKQLWKIAYREAATMAYADAFRAKNGFVVATAFVSLMRTIGPPIPTPTHRCAAGA